MKKLTTFFILSFVLTFVGQGKEFTSEIKQVTVFERGAQVNRQASITLKKGIQEVVLNNLSRYIDANTIQAKIPGAKIVSLSYQLNYLNSEEGNAQKKILQDSVAALEHELKLLKNELQINQQELKLIEKNVDIKGQTVLDVADLEDFLIFYRSNLPLIKGSMLKIEVKQKSVKQSIKKLKQELRNLNSTTQKVSGSLKIELSAAKQITGSLDLNYYVSNAGWTPYYNLRAMGLNKDIEMEFNANVRQNTGVEWENIQLVLATGTPHLDGNAPSLRTWYVNYQRQRAHPTKYKKRALSLPEASKDLAMEEDDLEFSVSANYNATSTQNITFREYKIKELYSITSTGKNQRVEIMQHSLPANYTYFSAPKVNTNAYLMAKVANWEQYNILSGQSKIYFEDTYVGAGYIDAKSTEDTLLISLGQDKNIVIERKCLFDQSAKQFIGTKQTKKKSFEITVRNNKMTNVEIEIVDQIPVSKNNEIKVKLNEHSGAAVNEVTGELKWLLNLQATEKTTRTFDFEISYPKNKKISL